MNPWMFRKKRKLLRMVRMVNDETVIAREKDYRDVVVTHIDENGKLKLQTIGQGTAKLETMMSQFKSFHLNPANSKGLEKDPKAGDFVAAKFTEDNQWYRARIRSNDRAAKQAEIVYIDYGNSEKMPWSRLRPLSQAQFSTQTLKPQAVDAILLFSNSRLTPIICKMQCVSWAMQRKAKN
jgi:staphylococcal nuclease domain-containing protein 1